MTESIKSPEQRPEHPEFWCKRFGEGVTPWDAGKVPSALGDFIATHATPLNTLIPGCGSAWEAAHLAEIGWPVTALDFSPVAIEKAREVLAGAKVNLLCADFFTFTPDSSPLSANSRRTSARGVPASRAARRTPRPGMASRSINLRKWVCADSEIWIMVVLWGIGRSRTAGARIRKSGGWRLF